MIKEIMGPKKPDLFSLSVRLNYFKMREALQLRSIDLEMLI